MSSVQPAITSAPNPESVFVDRRQQNASSPGAERRQFGNSHHNLTAEGRVLAEAIDAYKVNNRRRYITTDELLQVLNGLGYRVDSLYVAA